MASLRRMEQRPCGDSGLPLSVLGLGTMTFGNETDEAGAHLQLDQFVAAGGTFIDTADVYSHGASEEIIGRWIADRGHHDDIILGTKARMPMAEGPLGRGASRRHLTRALEASLSRLGTDHVDLYQIHAWDPATPIAETLETLDGFVAAGLVGYVGWSNVTGWQLQKILRVAEVEGLTRPVSLQPQYNLLDRGIELELLPQCLEEGIGLLPWSPLGGGWLTGKYRRDRRPEGATRLGEDPSRGVEAYDVRNTDETFEVIDELARLAEDHDATIAQIALAWVRQRPGVTSVILGARTSEQLQDNLGSLEVTLTPQQMDRLTAVSAPGIPAYPYGFLADLADVDWWQRLGTRR